MGWTDDTNGHTDAQVWRRAGGRRFYNAIRRLRAMARRAEVYQLWELGLGLSQSEIARRLGVHPSTVSRDIAGIGVAFRLVLTQRMAATTIGEMLYRLPPRRQWARAEHAARPVAKRPHRSRGIPLRTRFTIRLSDSLAHQVETVATERGITVSDILREALERLFIAWTHPPHTLSDCANALLQNCWPEERAWLQDTAASCNIPLERLLVVSVQHWWREGEPARVTPPLQAEGAALRERA